MFIVNIFQNTVTIYITNLFKINRDYKTNKYKEQYYMKSKNLNLILKNMEYFLSSSLKKSLSIMKD